MAAIGDHIVICVKEAQGLNSDTHWGDGGSLVFAQAQLGDVSKRTRAIANDLDPQWEEDIVLLVTDPYLVLLVRDENWDPDHYVGACKFAVKDIPLGEAIAVQLRDKEGAVRGKLVLECAKAILQPASPTAPASAPAPPVEEQTSDEGPPEPVVLVVFDAEDLDGGAPCSPYVVLQVGDVMKRTISCQNTSTPLWNEEFTLMVSPSDWVDISVRDEGALGGRVLGNASLRGITVLARRDGNQFWIVLRDDEGEVRGKVRLGMYNVPDVSAQPQSPLMAQMPASPEENMPNGTLEYEPEAAVAAASLAANIGTPEQPDGMINVTVKVVNAEGLQIHSQPEAVPTPFVVLRIGDAEQYTTAKFETFDPVWGERYSFTAHPDDMLDVEVRDHANEDEIIGRGLLPVAELVHIATIRKLIEITLTDAQDQEAGLLILGSSLDPTSPGSPSPLPWLQPSLGVPDVVEDERRSPSPTANLSSTINVSSTADISSTNISAAPEPPLPSTAAQWMPSSLKIPPVVETTAPSQRSSSPSLQSSVAQAPVATATPVDTAAPVAAATPIVAATPVVDATPIMDATPALTVAPEVAAAPVVTAVPSLSRIPIPTITAVPTITPIPVPTIPVVPAVPEVASQPLPGGMHIRGYVSLPPSYTQGPEVMQVSLDDVHAPIASWDADAADRIVEQRVFARPPTTAPKSLSVPLAHSTPALSKEPSEAGYVTEKADYGRVSMESVIAGRQAPRQFSPVTPEVVRGLGRPPVYAVNTAQLEKTAGTPRPVPTALVHAFDAADDGRLHGRPLSQASTPTVSHRVHAAAVALDAADGVMDGKFFGRPIIEAQAPSVQHRSAAARALDAADGTMDGKFFGRPILESTPQSTSWQRSSAYMPTAAHTERQSYASTSHAQSGGMEWVKDIEGKFVKVPIGPTPQPQTYRTTPLRRSESTNQMTNGYPLQRLSFVNASEEGAVRQVMHESFATPIRSSLQSASASAPDLSVEYVSQYHPSSNNRVGLPPSRSFPAPTSSTARQAEAQPMRRVSQSAYPVGARYLPKSASSPSIEQRYAAPVTFPASDYTSTRYHTTAAAALDAADGVMDGRFFGRPIVEAKAPERQTQYQSSVATALDAADGVMDGRFYERPIVEVAASDRSASYRPSGVAAGNTMAGVSDGQRYARTTTEGTYHPYPVTSTSTLSGRDSEQYYNRRVQYPVTQVRPATAYQSTASTYQSTGPTFQSTATTYQSTGANYQSTATTYQSTASTYQSTGPTYQSTGPTYQSSAAAALDAADGVMDGRFFGRPIIEPNAYQSSAIFASPEVRGIPSDRSSLLTAALSGASRRALPFAYPVVRPSHPQLNPAPSNADRSFSQSNPLWRPAYPVQRQPESQSRLDDPRTAQHRKVVY